MEKPPRIPPRIRSAPKARQLYWCDFPKDAQLPEFWKRRPVVVLSYRNTLSGTVTVVPCSTKEQTDIKWVVALQASKLRQHSWAICDKPTSVAVSRLLPMGKGFEKVTQTEFNQILEKVLNWLPRLIVDETENI